MAKLLVHLATGPENATRAALAGDAVQLARRETAEAVHGVGTGNAAEHWDSLRAAGVSIFVSGMSSKARGVDAATTEGIELAQPQKLVELATQADDATLTY